MPKRATKWLEWNGAQVKGHTGSIWRNRYI